MQGFAELEYGILRWMGAVDDDTPVVTTVHDCQVRASGLMHDVIVPKCHSLDEGPRGWCFDLVVVP